MGSSTEIEWCDATWNPWRGCDKVSPGCAYCYMFRDQERYGRDPSVVVRCADGSFFAPLRSRKWRELEAAGNRLVFTCSWSDWFHPDADEWRDEAWDVVRRTPGLTYQILTKRPELIPDRLPADWGDGYANVWLGVSIENRRFVGRADLLRAVPAVVRFISAEPLLGPLIATQDLTIPVDYGTGIERDLAWEDGRASYEESLPSLNLDGIDWLIVGGESGSKRKMDLQWARDLLAAASCCWCEGTGEVYERHDFATETLGCQDCRGTGRRTAFFMKQLGGARPGTALEDLPEDLRVREFPERPAVETGVLF